MVLKILVSEKVRMVINIFGRCEGLENKEINFFFFNVILNICFKFLKEVERLVVF